MEDKCLYCETFDVFKQLMLEGTTMEDAFHESVRELVNQAFSDAFDEGYVTALSAISDLAQRTIIDIVEDDCDECTCTCD